MVFINSSNIYKQNNNQEILNCFYFQEYCLMKEIIVYKFIIENNDEVVFMKCKNYLISINQNELS